MKEKQAYMCDHCGKLYKCKGTAISHEKVCKENHLNIAACIGCRHIEEIPIDFEGTYYNDDYFGGKTIISKMFHCNKLNKDLYPALVLRKKLHLRHPEHFAAQELMPSECEFYDIANFGISDYE